MQEVPELEVSHPRKRGSEQNEFRKLVLGACSVLGSGRDRHQCTLFLSRGSQYAVEGWHANEQRREATGYRTHQRQKGQEQLY